MRAARVLWCVSVLGCVTVPQDVVPRAPDGPRSGYRVSTSLAMVQPEDAEALRTLLESAGCVEVVEDGHAAVHVEGTAAAHEHAHPGRTTMGVVEAATLLPLVGLPFPAGARGEATANLYVNGRSVRGYELHRDLPYWTTVYSLRRDAQRALGLVRALALRDLAARLVTDLCSERPLEE